ncbi:MAG TPA: hypothetical protein VIS53_05555, partial [Candidatus Udaeobacter sp.]
SRGRHQSGKSALDAVTSRTHRRFWKEFNRLPGHIQCLAREKFQLWLRDPFIHQCGSSRLLEMFGPVRIGDHYGALAQKHGELIVWFWIGTHEDYNNFIKQLR